jgi:hypothetical protein
MAQYDARALNPQPLPPGRALNPQPLPPGIYAPGHRQPNIACRRVCAQTRSLGPATAPPCIRWQTVC